MNHRKAIPAKGMRFSASATSVVLAASHPPDACGSAGIAVPQQSEADQSQHRKDHARDGGGPGGSQPGVGETFGSAHGLYPSGDLSDRPNRHEAPAKNAWSLCFRVINPIAVWIARKPGQSKPRQTGRPAMQPWFIPMFYVSGAVLGGLALPRIEHAYLSGYTIALSVASAQAFLFGRGFGHDGADWNRFRHGFRDGAIQRDRLFPSARALVRARPDAVPRTGGVTATFLYALFTLAWVDRGGSAKVPLFSMLLVGIMIVASMLLFSRLMQRLGDLQIGNVLHLVGDQGRAVIGEMFRGLDDASAAPHPAKSAASTARLGHVTQTVTYFGKPRTVASLDVGSLVALAREARGTIVMACAVGDTLVEGTALLHVHIRERRYRRTH